jgi:hypothetical protein
MVARMDLYEIITRRMSIIDDDRHSIVKILYEEMGVPLLQNSVSMLSDISKVECILYTEGFHYEQIDIDIKCQRLQVTLQRL